MHVAVSQSSRRLLTVLALLILLHGPILAQSESSAEAGSAAAEQADATADKDPAKEEPEEEEEEEGITFNVRLAPEQGGGRVKGRAGDMQFQEGEYMVLTDGVDLRYKDLRLRADLVRVDIASSEVTAEGDVIFDQGPQRLTGVTLAWNFESRTGKITQATAYVDPAYYFSGDEISKVGELDYEVDRGIFTSCSDEVPDWSIALSNARITVGKYARIKNARFKLKRLPVLYFPYVLWPAKTERTSGFLVPKPGHSKSRGGYLGLAYYQTMGRSADATFFLDLYSKEFYGFGTELRYRPSENSSGILQAYLLSEPSELDEEAFPVFDGFNRTPGEGMNRWRLKYYHESSKLWEHWRGVIDFEQYSDTDFKQQFLRDPTQQSQPFIYSNAYLSTNRGPHSLNFLVDERVRNRRNGNTTSELGPVVRDNTEDRRRQLPEVEYRLRNLQLGSVPVYLSLLSSANYFSVNFTNRQVVQVPGTDIGTVDEQVNETETRFDYGRFDLQPTLSVPLSTLPWLSAKIDVSERITWYSDSLKVADDFDDDNPDPDPDEPFRGESLTRTFATGALEIVGPSFSRIFDKGAGRFSKFKHIIEPRWNYVYIEDALEDQRRVSLFDEVDNYLPGNGVALSLVQRLLAKPSDEEEGGAFEIASFELSQGYSFDDDLPGQQARRTRDEVTDELLSKQSSPITAALRFNPSEVTSFKFETEYNTLFSRLSSYSLSGGAVVGRQAFGLSWTTRYRLEPTEGQERRSSDQLRLNTAFELLPRAMTEEGELSLRFDSEISFDLVEEELLQQRHFLRWQSRCYGLELEVRETKYGPAGTPERVVDRDFRFTFSLKNVGKFLDMTGSLGGTNP